MVSNGWRAILTIYGERIVIPVDDLREHDLDKACWCHPFTEDGVLVHNSLDKRETYEQGRKLS